MEELSKFLQDSEGGNNDKKDLLNKAKLLRCSYIEKASGMEHIPSSSKKCVLRYAQDYKFFSLRSDPISNDNEYIAKHIVREWFH